MAVSADRSVFAQKLVRWQQDCGRHGLPWQAKPLDPYRVWVSEIMLQQTQVQTVIPYFERFMKRFPSLASLACAHEQDVLALWAGLGYYRRAHHLHACAQHIMREHHGVFPRHAAALAMLPGIGPSTAAAIASLVFHERVAILDGNVKRVLARVTCAQAPWASPALETTLQHHAQTLLPKDASLMPIYTQAMMDLGAMMCRAKDPNCAACPVRAHCKAHAQGHVHLYPRPRAARKVATIKLYWALFMNQQSVWLAPQSTQGIWPGLWLPWVLNLDDRPRNWRETARHLQEVVSMTSRLTHRRLEIDVGIFNWNGHRAPSGAPKNLKRYAWRDALGLPLPAPARKLLLRLCPVAIANGAAPRRNSRS